MRLQVEKVKIKNNPLNEVTSDKIFAPRRIRDASGNLLFNENGIFSEQIFGLPNTCKCGKQTSPGFCPNCGCRVIDPENAPDTYISFENIVDIPYLGTDYPSDVVDNLMHYKGFLYHGQYHELDMLTDNMDAYNKDEVLISKSAVLSLGVSEEWYNDSVYNKLYIPHMSLRPITVTGDKYFLGNLNTLYVDILKLKNSYIRHVTNDAIQDVVYQLATKKYILEHINEAYTELLNILALNKRSLLATELRGQPLTGIVRGVITNNTALHENYVIIGSYFAKTLYPHLCDKFMQNGVIDFKALNSFLLQEGYYVLLNRQPTIGTKSIMGMIPQFTDDKNARYILQLNPIIFDGLAADVDGDVLSVTALYSKEACEEAKKLLPNVNYIEGSNSSIRNGLPEDLQYAMQQSYVRNDDIAKRIHEIIWRQ